MITSKQVVDIVGKIADRIFSIPFDVEEKGSITNVVTSSDKAMQKALVEELGKLLPGSGFLGEEDGLLEEREYMWIIDPIDGTQNFSRHIEECCVSVGLLHNGENELGVVYMPFLKNMYWAEKGKGAYKNGEKIHVSSRPFNDGLLCTAMSLYRKEYAKVCSDIIYDAYLECNDVRRFGTCAYELCLLAEGKVDLYFEIRISPWDFVGSEIILKEAGGELRALDMKYPPHFEPTPLIGANSLENVKKLSDIVHRHLPEVPYQD